MRFFPGREVLLGLVGALLLVGGAVESWASHGAWCSGTTQGMMLTCANYCNPGEGCSKNIGQGWAYYSGQLALTSYFYCCCPDGLEDDCCHMVLIIDPPSFQGPGSRGICDVAQNCYQTGACHYWTGGSGTSYRDCVAGGE